MPPSTQTALAIQSTQTAGAAARDASRTAVARAATSTRQAVLAQRTQSAAATATTQAKLSQYARVNIQDLVSFPGSYSGEKIIVRAEVYEIQDDGREVVLWLFSYAGSGFMTAFPERVLTLESGVREGYTYNIYGTVESCPLFTIYDLDGYCLFDMLIP